MNHTSTKPIIGTWILLDSTDVASYYPQTGIKSSANPRVHEIYWRCVACYFATACRVSQNRYDLTLFTTTHNIPSEIAKILDACEVKIEHVRLNHLPPSGYLEMWRNQFYILDLILHITGKKFVPDSVILDSDCLFVSSIDPMMDALDQFGVLAYDLGASEDEDINGLTRRDMQRLFGQLLGRDIETPPIYYGGEFFAASSSELLRLSKEIEPAWQECMRRAQSGELKLNEEAHFLSFLYLKLGHPGQTADKYIRRIWTQRKLRDGRPSDLELPIWHLPAEKRFGYRDLFPLVSDRTSWFWSLVPDTTWKMKLASMMGLPYPSPLKRSRDLVTSILGKING